MASHRTRLLNRRFRKAGESPSNFRASVANPFPNTATGNFTHNSRGIADPISDSVSEFFEGSDRIEVGDTGKAFPARVDEIQRIAIGIPEEIRSATDEAGRVFADESPKGLAVVASSVVVEPGAVVFPAGELEWIGAWSARRGRSPEWLIGVGRVDFAGVVG